MNFHEFGDKIQNLCHLKAAMAPGKPIVGIKNYRSGRNSDSVLAARTSRVTKMALSQPSVGNGEELKTRWARGVQGPEGENLSSRWARREGGSREDQNLVAERSCSLSSRLGLFGIR